MRKTASIEIWALIDGHGNYVVSPQRRSLSDQWRDEIGDEPLNARTLRLTVVVELPQGTDASPLGVIALPPPQEGKAPTHVMLEA